jgi:hypothetical protein
VRARSLAATLALAIAACSSDSLNTVCDCRADQVCVNGACLPAPPPYVEPMAFPISCPAPALVAGGVSGPATEPIGCQKPVMASSLPPVGPGVGWGVIDLGVQTVGARLTFSVQPGTGSFTIVQQAVEAPEMVNFLSGGLIFTFANAPVPDQVLDPSHVVQYDESVGPTATSPVVPYYGASVVSAFTLPNTSFGVAALGTAGLQEGDWSFLVNDFAYECARSPGACDAQSSRRDSRYQVLVLTRPGAAAGAGSPVPDAGAIDVAVHLVDTFLLGDPAHLGITSADAPTSPVTVRLVEALQRLLTGAGVCLGTVTFFDAPDWAKVKFATGVDASAQGPCDNLGQIFTLSRPGNTLDLFLVPRIKSDPVGDTTVVGIDGTIPGPATVNGTVRSGAVVSAEDLFFHTPCGLPGTPLDLSCGPDRVAYVAAHEAGHYLGLFHITEASGQVFDPIADTPPCACTLCAANPGTCGSASFGVGGSACSKGTATCSGARNLMFWLLDPGFSLGTLSPDQGRVARLNPLVRSP